MMQNIHPVFCVIARLTGGRYRVVEFSHSVRVGRFGDRNPVGGDFPRCSRPVRSFLYDGCWVILGGKRPNLGTHHPPFLAQRLPMGWIYTSISPLCLHRHEWGGLCLHLRLIGSLKLYRQVKRNNVTSGVTRNKLRYLNHGEWNWQKR